MLSSATTILYDDPHIRVIWHPGDSDYVLVTFADLLITVDGHRFFADRPVAKAGISCIGVVATGANFYPKSSLLAALPFMLPYLSGFSRRVLYGGSMGGYGVIKHSRLLGASEVIALCPQWSIDPAECEGNFPGWPHLMQPALAGMGTRPEEIGGAVFVFADMFDAVDRFQAGMIKRADPAAVIVNVPMVQHHVVPVFAGTQTLVRLIEACRHRRVAELRAISRAQRKDSPRRLTGLIETAIGQHPGMVYRLMASRPPPDPSVGPVGAAHFFRAMGYLAGRGERAAAVGYAATYRHELRDPSEMIAAAAVVGQLEGRELAITTHHRTTLVYDTTLRVCVHVARVNDLLHMPVRVRLFGGCAGLYAIAGGVWVDLSVDAQGRLGTGRQGEVVAGAVFEIGSRYNGSFTLRAGGHFLSAEPDGPVSCDRTIAYEWEHFRLT